MGTGSSSGRSSNSKKRQRRQQESTRYPFVTGRGSLPNATRGLDVLLHPIVFDRPLRLVRPTAWVPHIPFAYWLVAATRPRIFVELGTHSGNSYSAFAQACQALGLDTACYAVDTWEGDHHSGFYSADVFKEWSAFHDRHFSSFSRLIRSTFDEASLKFLDASVDLLHIDGLHTYEAVRHDFDTWLPKMSETAVIVLHDTNVHKADFGVWRLWKELQQEYPFFAFLHGHGLGLVGVGQHLPPMVRSLLERIPADSGKVSLIRQFFSTLGEALVRQHKEALLNRQRTTLEERLTVQKAQLASTRAEHATAIDQVQGERDRSAIEIERLRNEVAQHQTMARQLLAERHATLAELQTERHMWRRQRRELTQRLSKRDAELERRVQLLMQAFAAGALRRSWRVSRALLARILRHPTRHGLRQVWEYLVIRRSGHFDALYYLRHNLDVLASRTSPLIHYVTRGAWEGKNPNSWFDSKSYLDAHPELVQGARNPFVHYLRFGQSGNQISRSGPKSPQVVSVAVSDNWVPGRVPLSLDPDRPAVSIICRTYNHEQHILRALEGFLRQKTTFRFVVIVGDDGSSDRTPEIIEDYARRYPEVFVPVLRRENVGPVLNLMDLTSRVESRYVALCDGDDFWTDETKLQRQVEFLESHPDYTLCFHRVLMKHEGVVGTDTFFPDRCEPTVELRDLVKANRMLATSVVYRWQFPGGLTEENFSSFAMPADWHMHILHARVGKVGYIDRVMAVYNKHTAGIFGSHSSQPIDVHKRYGSREIELFRRLQDLLGPEHHAVLSQRQLRLIGTLIRHYLNEDAYERLWRLLDENRDLAFTAMATLGLTLAEEDLESTEHLMQAIRTQSRISVVVTTYNHEKYIRECLLSILTQRGAFELEIVVGDDASTDRTTEIVREIAEQTAVPIRILESEGNEGMRSNLRRCLRECRGDYIAVCEGDDYWLSPRKLHKQLSFLRENPECAMCFNWLLLRQETSETFVAHREQAELHGDRFEFKDLIKRPFIGNFSGCFYRAAAALAVPEAYYEAEHGADWLFNLFIAKHGSIGFIRELLSVYRIHERGVWSGKSRYERQQHIERSQAQIATVFGRNESARNLNHGQFSAEELTSIRPDSRAAVRLGFDKVGIIVDTLQVQGWLYGQISSDVGLAFVDEESMQVVGGYWMTPEPRPDIEHQVSPTPEDGLNVVGFRCREVLPSGLPPQWRLAIVFGKNGDLFYIPGSWRAVQALNSWDLVPA